MLLSPKSGIISTPISGAKVSSEVSGSAVLGCTVEAASVSISVPLSDGLYVFKSSLSDNIPALDFSHFSASNSLAISKSSSSGTTVCQYSSSCISISVPLTVSTEVGTTVPRSSVPSSEGDAVSSSARLDLSELGCKDFAWDARHRRPIRMKKALYRPTMLCMSIGVGS